jgi:colanic acid biosynthesis glycosyl transferase WcaI
VRVDELARAWAGAGHQVGVLTGFPNHPEGRLHPGYRRAWWRGFAREERSGVQVRRTWLYPAANRGLWGRAANYASFACSAALVGPWVAPRNGVVIATSPQLLVGLAGYAAARARRATFVFEVRDLWPQSLEAVGQAGRHSLSYRALGGVAHFLYRAADHIVVDGDWKQRALATSGVPPEKISVVMNGVAEDFAPDPSSPAVRELRAQIRRDWRLTERLVVLYAGTLGMAHGLETVLGAAQRLSAHPDIVFVLIGEGARRQQLAARMRESRLGNVRFPGKRPRREIPGWLAAADLCLVPLRRSEVFKTAIPSKMFEAMAAARPVILGVEGEAREILDAARAGIAVPPEDPSALAEAILRLRNSPGLARELGANGRSAALDKYSRGKQARAYLELLARLTSAPAPLTKSSRVGIEVAHR